MKKISALCMTVFSIFLLFGCSEASENNNSALLLASGGSSGNDSFSNAQKIAKVNYTANYPKNVGENSLAGKKFEKSGSNFFTNHSSTNTTTIEFTSDQILVTEETTYSENSRMDACSIFYCYSFPYTYDAETQTIFTSEVETPVSAYLIRNDKKFDMTYALYTFTSRSQVYSIMTNYYTLLYNKITNPTIITDIVESKARYAIITTLEKQEKENEIQARPIKCLRCKFEDEQIQLYYYGTYNSFVPYGTKLSNIISDAYNFYSKIELVNKNYTGYDMSSITLSYKDFLDTKKSDYDYIPAITLGHIDLTNLNFSLPSSSVEFDESSLKFFKITSLTDDVINGVFQTRTGNGTSSDPYVYTDIKTTYINLEYDTTEKKSVVTMKTPDDDGTLEIIGTFEINYFTTPDSSSFSGIHQTYKLITE